MSRVDIPARVRWTCDACKGSHESPPSDRLPNFWFTRPMVDESGTREFLLHYCSSICAGNSDMSDGDSK
jgi:hypothetical protein